MVQESKVFLLLPMTFMNESGRSVQKCASYYKVPTDQLIVVTDDVALPLGRLRMRAKGSSGGHNGLKSVRAHLGTDEYMRLRVGVGNRVEGELADYVLGKFTAREGQLLPDIVESAIYALEVWLAKGAEAAMLEANTGEN